jgi:hypothetical protein
MSKWRWVGQEKVCNVCDHVSGNHGFINAKTCMECDPKFAKLVPCKTETSWERLCLDEGEHGKI